MQVGSIVDDALKDVQRFRILCMGRSGVGKSSLINRVFRLEKSWRPGHADIDEGFTSPENNYIVLHDSKGFELGRTETSNDVDRFIRQRCDSNLPLKDQLHAVWLCTETPRAGGRIFEKGDEDLLRLVRGTGTPVVIVLTKYDRLVKTKRVELQEDDDSLSEDVLRERSKEEAQKVLDMCIESLERTLRDMEARESQTLKPRHVNVSDQPGYEATISSLVQVTCELVSDKLKLMWAIAQRASRQVKINACVDIAMGYHKILSDPNEPSVRRMPLRNCLGRVHQDVITCWNFRDEEKTLSSDGFQDLILYLVQDVQESQNQDGPHITPPPAIDKISTFVNLITAPSPRSAPTMDVIGLTSTFTDWLSDTVLDNETPVQRLLMVYTTDLVKVLKSLFDIVEPSSSKGTMRLELTEVFQTYERSGLREKIHRRICANFEHDQQISDPASFRCELLELLECEPSLERKEPADQKAQDTEGRPALLPSAGEPPSSSGVLAPSLPLGLSVSSPEVHATSHRVSARPSKVSATSRVPTQSPPLVPATSRVPPSSLGVSRPSHSDFVRRSIDHAPTARTRAPRSEWPALEPVERGSGPVEHALQPVGRAWRPIEHSPRPVEPPPSPVERGTWPVERPGPVERGSGPEDHERRPTERVRPVMEHSPPPVERALGPMERVSQTVEHGRRVVEYSPPPSPRAARPVGTRKEAGFCLCIVS